MKIVLEKLFFREIEVSELSSEKSKCFPRRCVTIHPSQEENTHDIGFMRKIQASSSVFAQTKTHTLNTYCILLNWVGTQDSSWGFTNSYVVVSVSISQYRVPWDPLTALVLPYTCPIRSLEKPQQMFSERSCYCNKR